MWCRRCAAWSELNDMSQTTIHKSYKEKLRPTPQQERAWAAVLWRCRDLYNTALEQRLTAWQRCRVSVSRYEQEAELKAIRAAFPDYAAIHSHVLQDVLARLEKTYQAFFRRGERGEGGKKAGFPLFKGGNRFHSFTCKEWSTATAPAWTMASWCSPRWGGSACIGPAPSPARPRRSPSPRRRMGGMSPFPVPISR
jgi:hypothetical protein